MARAAPTAARVLDVLRARRAELEAMGLEHIALFGSVARGEAAADSDVDLLAKLDERRNFGAVHLMATVERLSDIVGCAVDLLPEPVRNPYLRTVVDLERINAF